MKDRLAMLSQMPLFGGIRDDVLAFLLARVREVRLAEGEFLFVENDPGDAMFVLEQGEVAILKRWHRIYYRLSYLHAGDCIGEMSMIDLGPRSASVLAMTDCTLLELSHSAVLDLYRHDLEQFASVQTNISRELSRRLRIADESLFRELIKVEQFPQH